MFVFLQISWQYKILQRNHLFVIVPQLLNAWNRLVIQLECSFMAWIWEIFKMIYFLASELLVFLQFSWRRKSSALDQNQGFWDWRVESILRLTRGKHSQNQSLTWMLATVWTSLNVPKVLRAGFKPDNELSQAGGQKH